AQELAFIANKTRELAAGATSRAALLQVASAAQRGLDESRRAIQTLTTSNDEPFEVALVQTVEEVADRLGAAVEIEAEPAPEITADQREQLLRIVRACLRRSSRTASWCVRKRLMPVRRSRPRDVSVPMSACSTFTCPATGSTRPRRSRVTFPKSRS